MFPAYFLLNSCLIKQEDSVRVWQYFGMKTLSALLAFCEDNSPVTSGFPLSKLRNADILFAVSKNELLHKLSSFQWSVKPYYVTVMWYFCVVAPWRTGRQQPEPSQYVPDHHRNRHEVGSGYEVYGLVQYQGQTKCYRHQAPCWYRHQGRCRHGESWFNTLFISPPGALFTNMD